ncbi:hypothetical protein PCC9214_05346 [Planktothrix tepida]|uniref:Uncharacterized protein n=1 Tax=Planktothrix tepida PCC 9214 TaxID=671072 RepID=A0A1J1LI23_9CYAN|nr:hypothetical protein [Planktothrix tepida]CAD5984850.1 hypothetical protein PCC9214_05308 [Planktothrix tepida]CAD5985126.1 hypothetical protein PCC9214_05346 [Planktothrix tepida]CUR32143.1 conserved hypothetical protein [Planktothrix tepida PCC 9214]
MDLDPQDIILALPDASIIKSGLEAIGTNVDAMQPTDELLYFVKAYEECQTAYNTGTLPDMTTVLPMTTINTTVVGDGIERTVKQTLQFKQNFTVNSIDPIIL